jgi:alkylation response protein AidB-like acyl-CoA dehydrogenase
VVLGAPGYRLGGGTDEVLQNAIAQRVLGLAPRVRSSMAIRDSLALDEDQRALQETLRRFLADQLSSAALRSSLDSESGYDAALHARMARELGLAGLTIPEEFGGLGMSQAEASVVHTELGRALYPGPFLPSWLAAGALLASADRPAAEYWLPRLADGSVTGTVATAGEDGNWAPGSDSVQAGRSAQDWYLRGSRWYVIAGQVANIVVVPAVTDAGPALFLVESGSPGFGVSRQLGIDLTRRVCVTTFDTTPAFLLCHGEDAVEALDRAEHELLIATAAEAAGGIGWCLDASIEYVKDREQFGRPIGSFEAVAHSCVDMLSDLQSVSAAARYAAVASADGATEARMAARVAALRAGEAYRGVTESAIHLFGGIGFTWEHDAHLYYRRAWSAERLTGGPHAQRAAIADPAGLLDQARGSGARSGGAGRRFVGASAR